MKRTDIINTLIKKINASKYLEIGVSDGINFSDVFCEVKTGVDIEKDTPATIHKSTDVFFENNKEIFDVIFVNYVSDENQLYNDIKNSLKFLNERGFIICNIKSTQNNEYKDQLTKVLSESDNLYAFMIDTNQSCVIISFLDKKSIISERDCSLNIISADSFLDTYGEKNLKSILLDFIINPDDPEINFSLAIYYEMIGHTASALSYYLRTAERTNDNLLKYECLIRGSICFTKQGTRKFTVKGMLQHAISIMPKRPEAYYMLSTHYEKQENDDGKWFDSYMIASIGIDVCDFSEKEELRTKIGYRGKYQLIYQKAVTSWWCGLCEESKNIFLNLYKNYEMDKITEDFVYKNLVNLGAFATNEIISYDKSKLNNLKIKFLGVENIEKNYSEAYQDMFVLTMLNGKKNGTYIEIGAGNSFYGNNTAILEENFQWEGMSIDIDPIFVESFTKERKNPCILRDATTIDYEKFINGLGFGDMIDYLQIDCDPAAVSLKILYSIPFESKKFAVITFEHDEYASPKEKVKEKSRKFLLSHGYKLVAPDISPDASGRNYEDWWVHPDLINKDIIDKMIIEGHSSIFAEDYMMGKIS